MSCGASIRRVGQDFGLRELGFKAQLIGHTETGIATVIRDFLPARMKGASIRKFAKLWASRGRGRRARRRPERTFLFAGRTRLGIHHQSRQSRLLRP